MHHKVQNWQREGGTGGGRRGGVIQGEEMDNGGMGGVVRGRGRLLRWDGRLLEKAAHVCAAAYSQLGLVEP